MIAAAISVSLRQARHVRARFECPGTLPLQFLIEISYRDLMDQFEGSRRLGDTSENNSVARECSCVIILKSSLNSTGHSARTR